MQLDKRINDTGSILTCFSIKAAKEYVGQQGFFAEKIHAYQNLDKTRFGTLARVDDDEVPFKTDRFFYQFFLPAEFVKPAEEKKKWRPFTLDEFRARFPLMSLVTYREKKHCNCYTVCVIGHECVRNETMRVNLGGFFYGLDNLFNCYELQDKDGNWTPFGVEA